MTNQVEGKVVVAVGAADAVVWRLQKADFEAILESTGAIIEVNEHEHFFEQVKAEFDIYSVAETMDTFLEIHGFTNKASKEFGENVELYGKSSPSLPNVPPEDVLYELKLSNFTEHLTDKYAILLNLGEKTALKALIISKFNVEDWTEYVATFIDIKGYHSPAEERL